MDSTMTRPEAIGPLPPAMPDLFGGRFDLSGFRLGAPQRSGPMTVVPVFGPERAGFAPPGQGVRLARVRGYGDVELTNPSAQGIAIVPLHIGFIQHGAQNHALCRSALIAPGKTARFMDACCVQAAQCGYLEGREQWFFVLPLDLRAPALVARNTRSFQKLWTAIAQMNQAYGLPARGHLEQVLSGRRAFLTQYQSRFERWTGQTGALFFLDGRLAGVEVAPSAAFFQDIWMPLVCFCYGAAAMRLETQNRAAEPAAVPFDAATLDELRAQLARCRTAQDEHVRAGLDVVRNERLTGSQDQRLDGLSLETVLGGAFAGQIVQDRGQLAYASLFAASE